jgi:hypothetical protein
MTHLHAVEPLESHRERLVRLLERAGDAAMRAKDETLAIECYSQALRIRYVTPSLADALEEALRDAS